MKRPVLEMVGRRLSALAGVLAVPLTLETRVTVPAPGVPVKISKVPPAAPVRLAVDVKATVDPSAEIFGFWEKPDAYPIGFPIACDTSLQKGEPARMSKA